MPYKDPEQQRAYQREWVARRRAEWVEGKTCVDCGTDQNLELDHVIESEKVSHKIWSWAKDLREAELAKCVPRCASCHDAKEARRRQQNMQPCGTKAAYERGCRCPECRKAKKVWNDKRYA